MLMRILPLLLALFVSSAANAQQPPAAVNPTAHVCMVDKTTAVDGMVFKSCDAPPENNALLMRGFAVARIDRNTIKSKQPIWVHGLCRYVDNRSNNRDVLVPFGTAEEWQTFNKLVPDIMKVAGCCVPRNMSLRDIPEPTVPCLGQWQLRHVLASTSLGQDANGQEKLPEEKMQRGPGSSGGADGIVTMAGTAVELPIARDDENTSFSIDGVREFSARWVCEGEPTEAAAPPPAVQDDTTSRDGNVLYVGFTVNCTQENWTPVTLQSFCLPYEGNRVYTCEQMGYAAGTKGEVILQEKTMCPTGATTRTLLRDGCEGEKVGAAIENLTNAPEAAATSTEAPAAAPTAEAPPTDRPKRTKPLVGQ